MMKTDDSFEDLRFQFGTGRSFLLPGPGRNRTYGYRTGVQCRIGDLEEKDWIEKMEMLIKESGEEAILAALKNYIRDHHHWIRTEKEVHKEALKLHSMRIFNQTTWSGYELFRNEYLKEE